MCGRYYIDEETAIELQKIITNIDKKLNPTNYVRDIVPSTNAPIIIQQNTKMSLELLTWGIKNYNNNRLLINARSETVSEKRTFRDSLHARRCIVPAKGFYEWDKSKNKFTFNHKNNSIMYFAGVYDEERRFVILTTEANESMEKIHNRMPVVLTNDMLKPWLYDEKETKHILNKIPPLLNSRSEMEQMRLDFL